MFGFFNGIQGSFIPTYFCSLSHLCMNHHLYCKFHLGQIDLGALLFQFACASNCFQVILIILHLLTKFKHWNCTYLSIVCVYLYNFRLSSIHAIFLSTEFWRIQDNCNTVASISVLRHRAQFCLLQKNLLISKLPKLLLICGDWPYNFTAVMLSDKGIVRAFLFTENLTIYLPAYYVSLKLVCILMFQLL